MIEQRTCYELAAQLNACLNRAMKQWYFCYKDHNPTVVDMLLTGIHCLSEFIPLYSYIDFHLHD